MLNILIPLAGKPGFFDPQDYPFPKPLIEVGGKPMIQVVTEDIGKITAAKRFVFIVPMADCQKYHLDSVLRLLTDNNCEIIQLREETKGAACSCLMAIHHIDTADPLVICNGDQHLDADIEGVMRHFESRRFDAGVICFESIHPKWSYVRMEGERVLEAAEKRPISKHAIAGFYYFRHGSDFVKSAQNMIKKDWNVNGLYYIAPTLNELILENRTVGMLKIPAENYHSFYSPQKIKEYEQWLAGKSRPAATPPGEFRSSPAA